jgi:hypothetical protein
MSSESRTEAKSAWLSPNMELLLIADAQTQFCPNDGSWHEAEEALWSAHDTVSGPSFHPGFIMITDSLDERNDLPEPRVLAGGEPLERHHLGCDDLGAMPLHAAYGRFLALRAP